MFIGGGIGEDGEEDAVVEEAIGMSMASRFQRRGVVQNGSKAVNLKGAEAEG